jgi:hypothetical protein
MGNWIPKYWWECSNKNCGGSHYTSEPELECSNCGKVTKSGYNPLHPEELRQGKDGE